MSADCNALITLGYQEPIGSNLRILLLACLNEKGGMMNLLNPRQIEFVLTSRLPGFNVSCTSRREDFISLCIRDMQTREIFAVSGIRPALYRGRYGALILAKLLMEHIQRLRDPYTPALVAARRSKRPLAEHRMVLSLITNH